MAEEKQHQALYRRYRPQTPAEVLGQDHVIRALTGAIREGRLAPRVPVLRTARDGQDLHRPDPGQDGQLRARPDPRAVRDLHPVRRHPRGAAPGRRRDRRGVARRRRGCARASRARADRPGDGPREGLHHRRGAAPLPRGVRRAAEGLRRAAARGPVRPGDDRAAQDAGHDRRSVPAVRFPAVDRWRRSPRSCRAIASVGGRHDHRLRGARDRAPGRGLLARRALAAGPGERDGRRDDRRRRGPARCSARRAARSSTSWPTPSRWATHGACSRSSTAWSKTARICGT